MGQGEGGVGEDEKENLGGGHWAVPNLILLAPVPVVQPEGPKRTGSSPPKGLSASSVITQSRKLHFLCN